MLNVYTEGCCKKIELETPDGLSVIGDKLYVTSHGGFVACIGLPEMGAEVEPPKTNLLPWFAAFGLLLIFIGILSLYATRAGRVRRR